MIEGMYTAASGMSAQQLRLDAVANDLANSQTTGYKQNRVAFRDLVYQQRPHGTSGDVLIGTGAAANSIGRNMAQGTAVGTQRSLDVALQGPGFLQVRGADGKTVLTRDGNLRLDSQGRICNQNGELLVPAVKIPKGVPEASLAIGRDGSIVSGNKKLGKLVLVEVRSPGQLHAAGGNNFAVSTDSGPARPARSTTILGSSLEASNTDAASAMVAMIEAQRAFQLASRAVRIQDQAWEIANQLKVR